MFEQTGGLDALYYFKIRSDNDTNAIYSEFSNEVEVFVESPKIECWDGLLVFNVSNCSEEPSPTPTEPTETPTPTPTESTPEPSNSGSPTNPEPTYTEVLPSLSPSPSQSFLSPEPSVLPSETQQPETIAPSETPPSVTDITPNDIIEEKINQLLEDLKPGEAVSFEAFKESGLDYEDLPPDTPIELENGVILTAEIADAIEIFENPTEVLATVFTNPGKAVKALLNVGADLPPKKRKQAQQTVFPMIIVGQIAASTTMTLMQRRV